MRLGEASLQIGRLQTHLGRDAETAGYLPGLAFYGSSIVGAICLSHALKAALSAAEKCCHSLGHTASSQFLRQETSHAMAPCMQRTGHLLMCHTATPLLHLR